MIAVLFQGCLNYKQEVVLYPDGSGEMTIEYWMGTLTPKMSEALDDIGIFNADSIKKEFTVPATEIESVEVFTDSSDSTTHAIIKLSFTHIDSLNKASPFSDLQFSLQEGAAGQKIFSQFIPPIATGFGFDPADYKVTYIYKFYGDIITHNATSEQGNYLIWEYSLAEIGSGKTISVTFRPFKIKETPAWIYFLSGLVLFIVIIYLFKKK